MSAFIAKARRPGGSERSLRPRAEPSDGRCAKRLKTEDDERSPSRTRVQNVPASSLPSPRASDSFGCKPRETGFSVDERELIVGVDTPSAASIIGKNTPGAVAKSCICAHCDERGHSSHECPALFAVIYGKCMPGFRCDGSREPVAWQEDRITPETAQQWLRMQHDGFFMRLASGHLGAEEEEGGADDDCRITKIEPESGQDSGASRLQNAASHCETCIRHGDQWSCLENGACMLAVFFSYLMKRNPVHVCSYIRSLPCQRTAHATLLQSTAHAHPASTTLWRRVE